MSRRELLSKMDSKEISEWMAYYQIEPFGEERDDYRMAILAAVIANGFQGFSKSRKEWKPEDFIPKFEEPTSEELQHKWDMFVQSLKGKQ